MNFFFQKVLARKSLLSFLYIRGKKLHDILKTKLKITFFQSYLNQITVAFAYKTLS